ncbi:hypothetical protein AB0D32_24015 [Micromonospora sp. NPDC048170]|uniref:hypothetical protein n=1 Tax=Micromonospora sp. NPDC048170 TaxID=3154819 RepID=UPI0033F6683E
MLEPLFSAISKVDWNDLAAVEEANIALLDTLDEDRSLLADLMARAASDAHLTSLSETLDHLDKIVLHDDPTGYRLRLHVFRLACADWPHSHRWSFTSRILEGAYQHVLYEPDDGLDESIDVASLRTLYRRTERKGDTYTIHHSTIHAALGQPGTVSLLVRGPSVKDRFLVTDPATGKAWWRYGAARENKTLVAAKSMSAEQLRAHVERFVADAKKAA